MKATGRNTNQLSLKRVVVNGTLTVRVLYHLQSPIQMQSGVRVASDTTLAFPQGKPEGSFWGCHYAHNCRSHVRNEKEPQRLPVQSTGAPGRPPQKPSTQPPGDA